MNIWGKFDALHVVTELVQIGGADCSFNGRLNKANLNLKTTK